MYNLLPYQLFSEPGVHHLPILELIFKDEYAASCAAQIPF